jgi:hypothetical protein
MPRKSKIDLKNTLESLNMPALLPESQFRATRVSADARLDDTAFCVSGGESTRMEPAIHAIETPLAQFKIMRLPGFDRTPPRVNNAGQVIRMNCVAGGPIL